jgi:hypothetical protein
MVRRAREIAGVHGLHLPEDWISPPGVPQAKAILLKSEIAGFVGAAERDE